MGVGSGVAVGVGLGVEDAVGSGVGVGVGLGMGDAVGTGGVGVAVGVGGSGASATTGAGVGVAPSCTLSQSPTPDLMSSLTRTHTTPAASVANNVSHTTALPIRLPPEPGNSVSCEPGELLPSPSLFPAVCRRPVRLAPSAGGASRRRLQNRLPLDPLSPLHVAHVHAGGWSEYQLGLPDITTGPSAYAPWRTGHRRLGVYGTAQSHSPAVLQP